MSSRKLTRYENQLKKKAHIEEIQSGSGIILYENSTSGTLTLPRPTKSGLTDVGPVNPKIPGSGQFQGDDYYMILVKTGLLKKIKTIKPSDPPQNKKILLEDDHQYESKEKLQAGKGFYLYENNTQGMVLLPKPTDSGVREVQPVNPRIPGSGRFQGDNYYMQMVPRELRLIKAYRTPEQETLMEENLMNENSSVNEVAEEKLILDQPETVTESGKVEHVPVPKPVQPLNEGDGEKGPEVLLNENPMDGIEIFD